MNYNSKRILRAGSKLHLYALDFAKSLLIFRDPLLVWYSYVFRKPSGSRGITFKNGLQLQLSNNPQDYSTLVNVTVQQEYGEIRSGDCIIDVGANVGIFACYAVSLGAARVLSYEPNPESVELIHRNIESNGFQGNIEVYEYAVAGKGRGSGYISVGSSPANSVSDAKVDPNDLPVQFIDLDAIIERCEMEQIDLLKIDCEGSEYEILDSMGDRILTRVKKIILEYHAGRWQYISNVLGKQGFELTEHKVLSNHSGVIYLSK